LFFLITLIFAVVGAVLSLLPGRKIFMRWMQMYTRALVAAFEEFCGVDVTVRGYRHLDVIDNEWGGACIIASKHQSYGDGPVMFSSVKDISFIADNHIEKFWVIRRILSKIGAVMVDNCGGPEQRERMMEISQRVKDQGRKILIYPEGHLSKVGTHHRYRKGIFHLYQDFGVPVVPVATNLGQRWNQNRWLKYPGKAVVEFLPPILPGIEDKEAFMAHLQEVIETRSIELLDLERPGALDPDDIGKLAENSVAREKREAREAKEREEILRGI
jgi:1-acyl-sn-glycerol-3-phosphate acyltransferase